MGLKQDRLSLEAKWRGRDDRLIGQTTIDANDNVDMSMPMALAA